MMFCLWKLSSDTNCSVVGRMGKKTKLCLLRCKTQTSGKIVGGPVLYCCQHKAGDITECLAFL